MKKLWKQTLWVRLWSLRNVFLLFFIKPSVIELNDRRCEIVVPLNWRTKRHDIHAMYLGTLCMGADVAGGLIAFDIVGRSKQRVSFIFKDLKAEFLKRAEDDVHFVCEEGEKISGLIRRTMETGEREEATVNVTATVPTKLAEPVARFALTLSLKRRDRGAIG
jgi:uncharacterized protein DUF4442